MEEPPTRSNPIDAKWLYRFLHRWQWSYQASNTKGSFLPDESQEMNDMRLAHRAQKEVNNCRWELTLNFDQLWRSAYEPPSKVIHKRKAKEAKRQGDEWQEPRPDDLCGKRLQAVTALAKQGLKSRLGQTERPSKLRKTCARTDFVVGGRHSVTAVTSTWASGHIGPLGICVASGSVPLEYIRKMNSEWHAHVHIFESGSDSHFMNADSTLVYLQELIAPAAWPNPFSAKNQIEDH